MFKRNRNKIITSIIIVSLVIFLAGHAALAQGASQVGSVEAPSTGITSLFGLDGILSFVTDALSNLVNILVMIGGWLVALSGYLLNISINLTLNIKSFVDATPAIYNTWRAIRDISSLFIIFALLFAAIQMIVGYRGQKFGDLIKNIVIAGVLINFSFFFAGLGIDLSNIVSVQLYNAIAPSQSLNPSVASGSIQNVSADGGLSNVFMSSLKLQSAYNYNFNGSNTTVNGVATSNAGSIPIRIILIGVISVMLELSAAISFTIAAMAFVIRFVLLLFLLAFSPIWFAAKIVPMTAEYADSWWKAFKGMLVFMPVYLLLMYLALNVLSTSPFFQNLTANVPNAPWYQPFVSLGINAVIVIILINAPLLAAASIAGKSITMLDKASKSLGAGALWGNLNKYTQRGAASTWKNTGGRAASKIAQSEGFKNFASNWKAGELALKATRATASGYDAKMNAQVKSRTEFADSLGVDQVALNKAQVAARKAQQDLASAKVAGKPQADIDRLEADVGKTKKAVADVENARKAAYASRTNTSSTDTLFLYTARKNKVAAAKIQIPILEKELTKHKDGLKEIRDDIKQLTNVIGNNPATATAAAGVATTAQQAALKALQVKEATKLASLNAVEKQIDDLKLVK